MQPVMSGQKWLRGLGILFCGLGNLDREGISGSLRPQFEILFQFVEFQNWSSLLVEFKMSVQFLSSSYSELKVVIFWCSAD